MGWPVSLVAGLGLAGVLVSTTDVLTRQQGDAFAKKVVAVQNHANAGVPNERATSFTQAETNSYLKFNATELLPTGLTDPSITMHGANRVSGTAVIDLDVVRQKQSSGGWLDPTSYLTGKLPVNASGRVVTSDGKGRIELERAEVSGVQIPKAFVNQLVNFFTRTDDNPRGSSVDDIFELPANIRRIDVDQGRFTVHQ